MQPTTSGINQILEYMSKGGRVARTIERDAHWTDPRPGCYGLPVHGSSIVAAKRNGFIRMTRGITITYSHGRFTTQAFEYELTEKGVAIMAEYKDWYLNRRRRSWW